VTCVVIANEKANWGASRAKVRQATDFLQAQGVDFSLSVAEHAGHARDLAAMAATQGVETVVVIGGDGTLNEVINGLATSGQERVPRLGIVPSGSSNDFCKSLGIPQEVQQACQAIVRGRSRDMDIGRAGPHYFFSASCLGYFADIAEKSLRMRRFGGSLRYTIPALSVIARMGSGWEMRVRVDDREFHNRYGVLLVGNTSRFGGLTMLPEARPDDGVLDCLLIEAGSRWEALHLLRLVYQKALQHHRQATRFQAKSLSVSLDHPTRLCHDGEVFPEVFREIDFCVLPRKLQVVC
jgi:diacylglycerol kinase (ATP)